MIPNRLKIGSTNTVLVESVHNDDDGTYATNATAHASVVAGECALYDATRTTKIVDLTPAYETGTLGTWRASIAANVALVDKTAYYARVTIIFETGVVRRFDIPCVGEAID